jgi:hypothetical protein
MVSVPEIEFCAPALVIATGPGNLPAVEVVTGGPIRFGSRPGRRPNPLCPGVFVTRTGYNSLFFDQVVPRPWCLFHGSSNFRSN